MGSSVLMRWYFEAICQGVAIGFCEILMIVWLTRHYTDPITLGVMLTVPAAVGAMTQALLSRSSRWGVSAQAMACLAVSVQVVGLFLLVWAIKFLDADGLWLFIGQCLYWIGGMVATSPTQEVLAKSVPVRDHNRFFSRRAILITTVTLICNFYSAHVADGDLTRNLLGLFVLWAAIARLLSAISIFKSYSLKSVSLGFSDQLETANNSLVSILRLGACLFLFRMSVNISSPFFSAYILNGIGANLSLYAFLTAVPLIVKMFCLNNWAKLLDDNRKFEGLFLAVFLIGIGPVLTGMFQNVPALVGFQIMSGVSWSGFDLISVLLVQHMYPRSITNKLGLFLALGSLGSVTGGLLGGVLFKALDSFGWLFACSSLARLMSGFLLLWYLRRHHLFRFHELNLRGGLATLVTVRPSFEVALKLIPLSTRRVRVFERSKN